MQPSDLIDTALLLVEGRGRKGKPRQADLKRAMSTAYYAMFHALCRNCADSVVGKRKSLRSQSAWLQAYRAVNHGHAKGQCSNMGKFPKDIQSFAASFVILQEKRHQADYDPVHKLKRADVLTQIRTAKLFIKKLKESPIKDRRAFAVWTVMQNRTENKAKSDSKPKDQKKTKKFLKGFLKQIEEIDDPNLFIPTEKELEVGRRAQIAEDLKIINKGSDSDENK